MTCFAASRFERVRRALVGALALLAVAIPATARANDPVALRIEGWWGGLKGADFLLTVREDGSDWDGKFLVRTAGLVRLISGLEAEADAHGSLSGTAAVPADYLQNVTSNKSQRTVEVGFDGDPEIGHRISDKEIAADPSQQKRDPENVPDLPEELRRGTMDPIAALLTIGRRALAGDHEFTLPIYDGRRRFDLAVTVTGPGHHQLFRRPVDTLDVVAIVHPVAGFKPYHIKWWNNARFDVLLDPKTGMLRQLSSSSFVAAVVLTTQAVCPPDTSCGWPPKN